MKHSTSNRKKQITVTTSAAIAILLIWQLLAFVFPVKFILAGPFEVAQRLFTLIPTCDFWLNFLYSTSRIVLGLLFGIITGVLFAVLAKKNCWLHEFFQQISLIFKSVPIALITIILLILFSSQGITMIVVLIMSFPIIYTNYLLGLKGHDQKLLEMATVFRWTESKKWKYIYLKAAEPYFKSGLQITSGMAWKAGIAAEIIGLPKHSVGEEIYNAKIFLQSADIFCYAIMIVLFSVLTEKIMVRLIIALHRKWRGVT